MYKLQFWVDYSICGSDIRNPAPPPLGYYDIICNNGAGLVGSFVKIQLGTAGNLEICEVQVEAVSLGEHVQILFFTFSN